MLEKLSKRMSQDLELDPFIVVVTKAGDGLKITASVGHFTFATRCGDCHSLDDGMQQLLEQLDDSLVLDEKGFASMSPTLITRGGE